ncbi:MAG: Grx4 family monothiol glutaredoxin [Myxococcales bacterium]|nr:Grx4 family monothiol glutaredoxin [Myxococcales bacterium]
MLFMKGNKSFPQCGFSATVVGILKELGTPFETANVLADPALRDGIKTFSDWPTIPQLYVNGEFVGGCDIVREMHASGELAKLLGVKVEPVAPPSITVSAAAAAAFKDAAEPGDTDRLRLEIGPQFNVDLYFGPAKPTDIEVESGGIKILVDPASAKRANGISIDYVDGAEGAGFKIDNPNAPATVKQIGPKELKAMLEASGQNGQSKPLLIDVRTEGERETAKLADSLMLEGEGRKKLESTAKDAPVVFYCHHGVRSLAAADHYLKQGFKKVYSLAGGIDAWSTDIDPTVPRY